MKAEDFKELPIALPPMLSVACGHHSMSRYFALYYLGSKATWDTGWQSSTFSYYAVYEPLLNHPLIAVETLDCDFGSDDGPPRHALLADRAASKLYVGEWDQVLKFLREKNPQPAAPGEVIELASEVSVDQLRDLGMFEWMLGASSEQQRGGAELLAWLDSKLEPGVIEKLDEQAQQGDMNACYVLMRLGQRMMAMRAAQGHKADEKKEVSDGIFHSRDESQDLP